MEKIKTSLVFLIFYWIAVIILSFFVTQTAIIMIVLSYIAVTVSSNQKNVKP